MVQMTRAALQDLIDRIFVTNNARAITAVTANEVLSDIVDSVDILASGSLAPQIRAFSITGQDLFVDPGTTLTGTKTFTWTISEEDNVSGNLTLQQGASTLSSSVDPKAGTVDIAINSVTLNAAEEVVFTLSGTDTFMNNFSRTFTVTARSDDDYVYIDDEDDNDPSNFAIAGATRIPFAGTQQQLTVPTFAGNQYVEIIQKSTEPDLTGIFIDGVNQIKVFTKTPNALTVNAANFDAWTSNNELVGSVVSGDVITITR